MELNRIKKKHTWGPFKTKCELIVISRPLKIMGLMLLILFVNVLISFLLVHSNKKNLHYKNVTF